jgi:hypothetical protein
VLQLWNWLLPPLFGWRPITFWQALGILALCRILFGGFGRHGFYRSNFRRRMEERMADRMAERWEHMTPEEWERFRQRMAAAVRLRSQPILQPYTARNRGSRAGLE